MVGLANDERCLIYSLHVDNTAVPKELLKYFQINERS